MDDDGMPRENGSGGSDVGPGQDVPGPVERTGDRDAHAPDAGATPSWPAPAWNAQESRAPEPDGGPDIPVAPPVAPLGAPSWGPPLAPPRVWGAAAPHEPPAPPVRVTPRLIGMFAALALAAGAIGGAVGVWRVHAAQGSVTLAKPPARDTSRPPGSLADLAAADLPGVVYIHTSTSAGDATGTGFVLDTGGDILTNNHVIADAAASGAPVHVTFFDGTTVNASVTGRDTGYDLAVLHVSRVHGLVPLRLGNSDTALVGDPVIAIGAPYDLDGTVTAGIISARDRAISAGEGSDGNVSYLSALQTDAPINPGNSGGPLIDASGAVIGVNSAIRSSDSASGSDPFGSSGQSGSIGLGFAIPINQARTVAQQLMSHGKAVHPVIGVTLDVNYQGDGAKISDTSAATTQKGPKTPPVTPGGPADKAGLKAGDVITAVDGRAVHSADEFIVAVREKVPGDTVAVAYQRGGATGTANVKLGGSSGDN